MPRFEITYLCKDEDWLGWRVEALDFHEAARAAFSRLDMSQQYPGHKLNGARLLRIERLPEPVLRDPL